ncbi:MAG: penicillin-binding transpeptidase domain-containing protein [Actinomycetota bacterium]|nr:penicillin-binding transpeptidase domain-containing protein [Actinomycetota bacterium]
MGRRIRWLGLALAVCFALVLGQLANLQMREAQALDNSPQNPRIASTRYDNFRGDILAANGEVLARSVKAPKGSTYRYLRQYPTGPLFAQIVGYDSPYYGTNGVEAEYNRWLLPHSQAPQDLGQVLTPPPPTTDSVSLTVEPYLQAFAQQQLSTIPSANKDGAIVVLDPRTGAVLAMASSPTFTPNLLVSPNLTTEKKAGHADFTVPDHEGFYPGVPLATFDPEPPGSTFKVVTTSAVYNLKPSLENFKYPVSKCTKLPDSTKTLCNDATSPAGATPCGGTIPQMLPPSCDPGYANLGLALGGTTLWRQAELFGYNQKPPIDLPDVSASTFPAPGTFSVTKLGPPGLAYSAFGQQDVKATALQQAMVAAAVADGGNLMTPHVLSVIRNSNGQVVKRYQPTVYKHTMTAAAAAQVSKDMQLVATAPDGTAYGIFPASLKVAVKTGTAQTGLPNLSADIHDWMIGFAPYTHPKVAVCVMVPFQPSGTFGATTAGPIMRAVITAALHPPPGQ